MQENVILDYLGSSSLSASIFIKEVALIPEFCYFVMTVISCIFWQLNNSNNWIIIRKLFCLFYLASVEIQLRFDLLENFICNPCRNILLRTRQHKYSEMFRYSSNLYTIVLLWLKLNNSSILHICVSQFGENSFNYYFILPIQQTHI